MAPVPSPGTTGNDIIIPGIGGETLYGDPFVEGRPLTTGHGGNDRLSATGTHNTLFGDANAMFGDARGGNDSLTATSAVDFNYDRLFGDAYTISGDARGGNDHLNVINRVGSFGFNYLYGRRPRHVR